MRKIILVTFFILMMVSALFTSVSAMDYIEKCRLNEQFVELGTLKEQVEYDLQNGMWTIDYENGSHQLQFHEYGLVDVYATNQNGHISHYSKLWRVEEFSGSAFLVLTSQFKGIEQLYKVQATCEGLILSDMAKEGNELTVRHEDEKEAEYITGLYNLLIGEWVSTTYPFDILTDGGFCGTQEKMEGVELNLQFESDGTYEMHLDDAANAYLEQGIWNISKDGAYILFHVTKNSNPESTTTTRMAKLSWLEDGMIGMEQSLISEKSAAFCTKWKSFSFAKYHVN